jgi:hypothetical protein
LAIAKPRRSWPNDPRNAGQKRSRLGFAQIIRAFRKKRTLFFTQLGANFVRHAVNISLISPRKKDLKILCATRHKLFAKHYI